MAMTHVGLNFDYLDYMNAFDVPGLPCTSVDYKPIMSMLLGLPTLVRLDIIFCDPRWVRFTHPWSREPHSAENAARVCHDIIVGMILTCALPLVRNIRTVRVEGYVKKRTRDSFYENLNDLKANPNMLYQRLWKWPISWPLYLKKVSGDGSLALQAHPPFQMYNIACG
jgi:hypothetical protein